MDDAHVSLFGHENGGTHGGAMEVSGLCLPARGRSWSSLACLACLAGFLFRWTGAMGPGEHRLVLRKIRASRMSGNRETGVDTSRYIAGVASKLRFHVCLAPYY